MTCGLFDKYPKLTLILGHLGETLPNAVWRIDHRIGAILGGIPSKRSMTDILLHTFYASTSGNYCTQTLLNTLLVMGADRVLFAVDYPFGRSKGHVTRLFSTSSYTSFLWMMARICTSWPAILKTTL